MVEIVPAAGKGCETRSVVAAAVVVAELVLFPSERPVRGPAQFLVL